MPAIVLLSLIEHHGGGTMTVPGWEKMSVERLWQELNDPRQRPTPQVTVEGILYSVRERGLGALKEPDNIERLSRCDAAARKQINQRIAKMGLR